MTRSSRPGHPSRKTNMNNETLVTSISPGAEWLLVSPTKAEQWLKRFNTGNRLINRRIVDAYASDMRAGKWRANGETIIFSSTGRLLDGQHRLMALIKADISIMFLITRGVEDDAFVTIDRGVGRSIGTVLHLKGQKNAYRVAAVARWVLVLDEDLGSKSPTTEAMIERAIEEHPLILKYAGSVKNVGAIKRLTAPAMAQVVLCAEVYGESRIDSFIDSFGSGEGLHRGDPVFAFREWILMSPAKRPTPESYAMVAGKCLLAYCTGREMKVIRFGPTERMPRFKRRHDQQEDQNGL